MKLQVDRIKSQRLLNKLTASNSNNDLEYRVAPGPYWKLLNPHLVNAYFTVIKLGNNGTAHQYILVVDTGSELTWTQCSPCEECFDQASPIFDPKQSATFSTKPCAGFEDYCVECNKQKECVYEIKYGDNSYTKGVLAEDVVRFGEDTTMTLNFGCAHQSRDLTFIGSDGILGLDRGPLSFASDIEREFGFKKYSYCLVDRFDPQKNGPSVSSLRFGNDVLDYPNDAVFTPMVFDSRGSPGHFIKLTGISVAGKYIGGIHERLPNGVLVDSGTTLTLLPKKYYEAVRDPFRVAALELGWQLSYPGHQDLDTCYDLSGYPQGISKLNAPEVKLFFYGDDECILHLRPQNVLINFPWISTSIYCLAFTETKGTPILGNVIQQGYRVIYDHVGFVIGFDPNSC